MKNFDEFLDNKYAGRPDPDNMFGVGISDKEFVNYAIEYLLGPGWYIVDPLGRVQINEIALIEILKKYSTRYKKEHKKYLKERRKNNGR